MLSRQHRPALVALQPVASAEARSLSLPCPRAAQVKDISLEDYIAVKAKSAVFVPHTAGRYQKKRFRKAQCPIIERLTCSLMMHGRNNGKKLMANRIVAHAFEIIHLLTDQNPLQVAVDAIINSGPREDATRIGSAGGRPPPPLFPSPNCLLRLAAMPQWQLLNPYTVTPLAWFYRL